MDSKKLIELTKQLIYEATHFNVPYVQQIYSDNLLIVKVSKDGTVDTMNKEQLVSFVKGNNDAKATPFSTKAEFHYAVCEGNMGMVVMTRDLELNGNSAPKFFTLIWEYSSERWQVAKESYVELN
ncbi:hypothetical protein MKS83_18125 [Chryseobacterium sp. Y16C]|uniref:hypothetical protein n=1 Tax=Chryseobacterium sp. Y16C TaxID=2920939 RepID=UPI001F0B3251|nr:hypothetical protein [Chryseobacterium sp. Y16C]UMQ41295.1 hypothetical protein MKS83_18125 [Chryseobacterium sp. Y16C]